MSVGNMEQRECDEQNTQHDRPRHMTLMVTGRITLLW